MRCVDHLLRWSDLPESEGVKTKGRGKARFWRHNNSGVQGHVGRASDPWHVGCARRNGVGLCARRNLTMDVRVEGMPRAHQVPGRQRGWGPSCAPSMSGSLEVEVLYPQPDGGEGLAKCKGGVARRCLKEARSKPATGRTETGSEAVRTGRAGKRQRSPFPSTDRGVNPAGGRGRRSSLPRETGTVSGIPHRGGREAS
jgi:hypothetical protein